MSIENSTKRPRLDAESADSAPAHSAGTAAPPPGRVVRLARQHGLFAAVLLVAAAVRLVVMLAYPGPLLYPDTITYLANAVKLAPNGLRPMGYSIMLAALKPLHSVAAVLVVQHVMGLVMGALGYALLRRYKVPGWGATLAMVPVLLSAYEIQMEHFLLSDTLFAFLVLIAVVLMAWWRDPPLWACALAGLLLAASAIDRPQGEVLAIVFVIYLLVKFASWRTVASVAVITVACALPLVEYATGFDEANGSFNLTTSNGNLFYAEVSTFADCAKIHPPADERFMCLKTPPSQRVEDAVYYMFKRDPLHRVRGGLWGNRGNELGQDFALRAIRAQPLDYARAVGENFAETFALHSGDSRKWSIAWGAAQSELSYMFPAGHRFYPLLNSYRFFVKYDGVGPDRRIVRPYATFVLAYQRYVVLAGPLLGLIALTGLIGLILGWRRRGGPGLLPWLTGMALLVIPDFILFDVRFVICTVPLLCISAAFGVGEIAERARLLRAGRGQGALQRGAAPVAVTAGSEGSS